MIDISISDLYGYNINNDSSFIIIKTDQAYKLLKKIASYKNTSIYEIDYEKMNDILNSRDIDVTKFVSLGHTYYDGNSRPNMVILCNKNICVPATKYIDIESYNDGKIVMPVHSTTKYLPFGLIYTKTKEDLNLTNVGLVPKNYLINIKKEISELSRNEFYLLSHSSKCIYSLNRKGGYTNDPHLMKLTNIETKYLTMIDGKPKLKNKLYSKNQNISYNTQGELLVDDKCLTHKNDKIFFDKCENKKEQMWEIYDNRIYPLSEPDKCISSFGENIELKQCSSDKCDESTIWNTEESDIEKTSDYKLKKYKGKTMVLVDSDDPWYLNRDITMPVIYHDQLELTGKQHRNNADFGSYDNRWKEHFQDTETNQDTNKSFGSQTQIILLLIIIVIILFSYKYIKNDNKYHS